MSQADIEVAEAAVRFWNQGDRDRFLSTFHPEGEWSSAIKRQVEGGDGLYRGRDEIASFWDEWHAVWDDLTIRVSEIRSPQDGRVFAFGGLHGIGVGSGVSLERPFAWTFQIQDGLIRMVRAYFSREEALKAAGLED